MSQGVPDVEEVVGRTLGMALRGALAVVRILPPSWISGGARALFSKSWGIFEQACADPQAAQWQRLQQILAANSQTQFGRQHHFSDITSVQAYRERVPVRDWPGVAPYVRQMLAGERNVLCAEEVFYFARSSGTTGEAKSIPVTSAYLDEFRHGRRVWTRQVAQVMPRAIRGHILTVHSPNIEGRTAAGTPYGSITVAMGSGREDVTGFDAVPKSVFRLADHRTRYYLALRHALQRPISVMAAVNPSTLMLLCDTMRQRAAELAHDLQTGGLSDALDLSGPQRDAQRGLLRADAGAARRLLDSLSAHGAVRPVDVWPLLAGVLCWKGGSAPFYLRQLEPLVPGLPIMDYGYAASEGNFTVPLDASNAQGVAAAAGHVLEFIPWDAYEQGSRQTLGLWELEAGARYVVVITGSHGLYRYDMQDVVEVTGFRNRAPVLAFLHKAGNMVSITGEKLAESQVVEAVTAAAGTAGLQLAGFTLAPEMTHTPRYVLAVEPSAELPDAVARDLLANADQQLQRVNMEYAAKRQSLRLGEMVLRVLPPGSYQRHRAQRVAHGAPDAHVKSPHLMRSVEQLDQLAAPPPS